MKVLLQNVETKFYYGVLGVWTPNPSLAYHFRHPDQALEFARKNKIADVQFMVRFDDPQWQEIVPTPLFVASLPPRQIV